LPIFILHGLSTTILRSGKYAKILFFPTVFSVRNKWYINRLKYSVCYIYRTTRCNTLNLSALCTLRCVFGLCTAIRINSDCFLTHLYQMVFVTNIQFVFCEVETYFWCVCIIKPFNAYWLRDAPIGLTLKNLTMPTLYLCVLCRSENKQRLFPYTTITDCFL
jgi:hypothetical protein